MNSEIEKLSEIYDFGSVIKLSLASLLQPNPLQYCQDMLPIKMKPLKSDNSNYKMIMNYLNSSLTFDGDNKCHFVKDIIEINEDSIYTENENKIFNNVHNHWLLWHGTKNENLMSILLKGLKVKPPNAAHTGSLFGNGIYFADMATKSLDYTSSGSAKHFYMLLCEVALGNVANYVDSWEVQRPPPGHHSVRIMGAKGPDFSDFLVLKESGAVVPLGEISEYPLPKFTKGS